MQRAKNSQENIHKQKHKYVKWRFTLSNTKDLEQ